MARMTPTQLNEVIAEIIRRVESDPMQDGMQRMEEVFRAGVADNFQRAMDSEGRPWPDRKEEGDGHPLLIDPSDEYDLYGAATGGSITRIENRAFESGVSANADHPGALIHNFGGDIPNAFGLGISVHIPQREYLYASEATLDAMADILADQVQAIVASVVGGVTVGPTGSGQFTMS